MALLSNIETQITETQLINTAITTLETELGIELITFAETPVPLWPFIAAGFAIYDIINLFSGGKPTSVDTNNVIRAYNMSAYQPLHLLAADLSEMLKNGAPISDSRSQIQAQFGQLKQGTVESIQSFAGSQPGPSGDGYWQLFNLIQLSWQYATDYNRVLSIVKAIDAMTIGISQLEQQKQAIPPPPSPPPIGPGPQGNPPPKVPPLPGWPLGTIPRPCIPADSADGDEITALATCLNENLVTIAYILYLAATGAIGQGAIAPTNPGNGSATTPPPADDECCANVTAAITAVATAAAGAGEAVATAIAAAPAPSAPDLTALTAQIEALTAKVGDLETCVCGALKQIADSFSSADALATDVVAHWATLFPGDPGTMQLVLS